MWQLLFVTVLFVFKHTARCQSVIQETTCRYHDPEEEIARGPACWLWDYLRRSGASGFLLPLSGRADSASVAAIVGFMCQLVVEAASAGDELILREALRQDSEHHLLFLQSGLGIYWGRY